MGSTVNGKRGSGIVVALAIAALFSACGTPSEGEPTGSQAAASKKAKCDASVGECEDDDEHDECEDDDEHGRCDASLADATSDARRDAASDSLADVQSEASEAGACRAIELVASKSYTPSAWNDAVQSPAPSLRFKLPAGIPVTSGNAGNHWLTFTYSLATDAGADAGSPVTCRYRGGASQAHPSSPAQIALGLQYVFASCTSGATPGTVVEADQLTLHVDNGDSWKSPTTVKLALTEEAPCGPPTCTPQTCDDHDACNGVENCVNGACQSGTAPTVDDQNACTVDTCNASTGVSHVAVAIDDSDACTVDSCNPLTGVSHVPVAIDDQNPCTIDACNAVTGVSHTPAQSGTSCGAAPDACSGAFTCNGSGQCVQGAPPAPDDQNACTADACDPNTGVSHTPVVVDDGNACTADACNPQTGVSHTAVNVDDGDACTVDTCNPQTGVSHAPVNVDDSDACTVDTCNPQTGVSHVAVSVDDGNACTADACNPITGVSHVPVPQGSLCGVSQDACSGAFACDGAGACVQGPPPSTDDGNDCTADTCNPVTGVSHTPVSVGTACGDNSNKCVGAFACNETASCVQGPAPTVDDQNPCTADSCSPSTGVSHTPLAQGTPCGDNSNLCAGAFTCSAQASCVLGPAPTVDDGNVCTVDACNPNSGVSHTAISGCDPSPTEGEGVFEKRASLLGRVVDKNGSPIAGFTFQVRDLPQDTPRNDVSVTAANDGSFRIRLTTFADHEIAGVGAQHVSLWIDSPGTIRAYRDAWVRPGDAPNLGDIVLVTRDPKITVIGAAGGTATDSQGLVEVVIPPGALAQDVPVQITPFLTRAEVPAVLPDATLTTYAFELEPEGTQFSAPATVRTKNYRNVPSTVAMPAGVYDRKFGAWEHVAAATLTGQFWQFPTSHFSTYDVNGAKNEGDRVVTVVPGTNGNGGAAICGGSTLGVSNGALRQMLSLPGTTVRGQRFGITLNYDSGLAGSRQFDYGPSNTKNLGAISQSNFTVAIRGTKITSECVAKGGAAGGGGGNSCVVGGCVLGGTLLPIDFGLGLPGALSSNAQTLDANQTSAESGTFLTVPLDDQQMPVGTGFVNQTAIVRAGGGGACAAGSQTATVFGAVDSSANRVSVPLDPGPLAEFEERTLLHHRHASPFGAGWGISEVGRLFTDGPDRAILVSGDGTEEEFRPRGERTTGFLFPNTSSLPVFARDPLTSELFAVTFSGGQLVKFDSNLAATTVFSGLALPGGRPHDMAITYVNGQRVFVVAADSGLAKIDGAGTVTVLAARVPNGASMFTQAHVAARGTLVTYVSGEPSARVLYKLDLGAQSPTLVALTTTTNGDRSLDPSFPLAQVQLDEGTGMAFGADGSLYLADKAKNALYRILPDSQGEIGPTSVVRRVVGRQGGTFILPRGQRLPGTKLPLPSPIYVTSSSDGTILVATAFGLAQYDPTAGDARWLAFNRDYGSAPDLIEQWTTNDVPGNVVAVGPRSFVFSFGARALRVDVPIALASEYAPTRTLELSNGQYFLVDGQAGTKEVYDAAGRLTESRMRTGEPVFSVQYADATSARIASMTDAAGGAWTFVYAGGKLSTITDPSGRVNRFNVDGFGDLASLITAEGSEQEAHTFAYVGHKMTSKTSPAGQSTTYQYSANGNIAKATKPTGEVTTMAASLDSPPQKDANGSPLRVGTYTTPFGVSHTVTTNVIGMIDKDVWTADAVTYTRQTIYDPVLYEGATDARRNTLLRPSYHTLNGAQEDRYLKWDSRGRLLRVGTTSNVTQDFAFFSYDANDRLIRFDGPSSSNQDITRWEYVNGTPEARLVRVFRPQFTNGIETNVSAQETRWQYLGPDPHLPSAIQTHGVSYTYAYDSKGNLTSVTDGLLQGKTVYAHDPRGNVIQVDVHDGANALVTTSSFAFDSQDRLVAARDAQSHQTDYDYKWQGCGCTEGDKLTGVHTPDLPVGKKWQLEYDTISGRLAKLTDPDDHVTQMGYTAATNRLASLTDANLHSATMGYDALGRLAGATDALARTYTRGYPVPTSGAWSGASVLAGSPNGTAAPTDLTAPLGDGQYQIGISRYQTSGSPAQLSFYRDATFELSYGMDWDNAKRLTHRRDRAGTGITAGAAVPSGFGQFEEQLFSYDNRTSGGAVTRSDATYVPFLERTDTTYNDELDVTQRVGDGQRLPSVLSDVYTRDAAGRPTQIQRRLSTVMSDPGALGFPVKSSAPQFVNVPLTKFTYDANGRIQQWTDADGVHDVFYDSRGLLAKLSVQGEGDYLFDHDEVGRNTKLTYPGGLVRTQAFDHEGRLTDRCYVLGTTRCYHAAYDAVGNPISLQDPEDTDTISYDALDRLKSVQRASTTETYSYNALGALHDNGGNLLDDQRPKLAGGGNASSAVPATYNNTPVTLDAGGRITLLDGIALKYSRRGALLAATKSVGQTLQGEWYGHDPEGRRISRTVTSTTNNVTTFPDEEYFAYTGANVTARLDKTGAVRQAFLFEGVDRPLRLRDAASAQSYYYELDIAGNVRRLRRPNGADAGGYRYAGFGAEYPHDQQNPVPAVDQPLRWKARWWSDFSGLYDVRARQWSPVIGSFTSVDEFAYHHPLHTLWGWPGMSPILWRDPSGHDFESTGAEGWFLRNSDELMVGAAVVTVSALTFGTADAVFALTGSAAVALGAAGGVGVLGAEGFNQFRSGCFNGWDLADAAYEGVSSGLQIGSFIDMVQSGLGAAPRGRGAPPGPPVRRLPTPGDKQFPTKAEALAAALKAHGIDPTTVEITTKYGKNPSLIGPKGEPWELISGLDKDANIRSFRHDANGHYFDDDNTFERPHYHGPKK